MDGKAREGERVGTSESTAPTLTFADLFPRDRADVGNVPTYTGERFHGGNDPENDESNVNDRSDDSPEKYQDSANRRNCAKNRVHDRGNDIEQKPGQPKDDRLHRIKTHERVVFFQNEKDDAADQWNTGERGRDIGRQPSRFWRVRDRRRRRCVVGHNLVTQDGRLPCQPPNAFSSKRFSFFEPAKANTVSL